MVAQGAADGVAMPRYGSTTVALHWVSALLILTLMASGLIMEHVGPLEPASRDGLIQFHVLLGVASLAMNAVRCLWRFGHKPPPPATFRTEREAMIGEVVHGMMYFLMIFVPLAGWAFITAAGYDLAGGGASLGLPLPELPLPADVGGTAGTNIFTALHDYGAWFLLALIGLHMTAAIAHHFNAPADRLMGRIWFGKVRDGPNSVPAHKNV